MPWDVSYNVSGGSVAPSHITMKTSFMPTTWNLPAKVFDAVHDHGAKGDAVTDDAASIQACVNAAASHGNGASCYLRSGTFIVSKTIAVEGQHFAFEGAGWATFLLLPTFLAESADEQNPYRNATVVRISSKLANNVTIYGLNIGQDINCVDQVPVPGSTESRCNETVYHKLCQDSGRDGITNAMPGSPFADSCGSPAITMDAPTGGPRTVHIDRIFKGFRTVGIVLRDLGSADTVRFNFLSVPLNAIGSAQATMLVNYHHGQYLTVAASGEPHGPQQPSETNASNEIALPPGFMGELVRTPCSGMQFPLVVRDSSSVVIGDFYAEAVTQVCYLSGVPNSTASGRVTMSGIKYDASLSDWVVVSHYRGQIFQTQTPWTASPPLGPGGVAPPGTPNMIPVVSHVGAEPVQLVFFGKSFVDVVPEFKLDTGATLFLLANSTDSVGKGPCQHHAPGMSVGTYCAAAGLIGDAVDYCVLADRKAEQTSDFLGDAWDHLRTLGLWDLYLNFRGGGMPSTFSDRVCVCVLCV